MTPVPRFDLQAHSTVSDGVLAPAEVVLQAKEAGIELLALTDHDSVAGVDKAMAVAREQGMAFSPAVEISSVLGERDLHVLGYEIDHRATVMREALEDWREDRKDRIIAMAKRLEDIGFELELADLRRRKADGRPLGRPHLAEAVFGCDSNAPLLAEHGIVTRDDMFASFLIPGGAAYVPRTRPTVKEAIDVVHAAGGVAVWAHPFWDVSDMEEVRDFLVTSKRDGLDGVEAFYVTHTRAQTAFLVEISDELDLLRTGSADFHGASHEWFKSFGSFELFGFEPRLGPIGERVGKSPA